jgi:hypothetical protein
MCFFKKVFCGVFELPLQKLNKNITKENRQKLIEKITYLPAATSFVYSL